MKFDESQYSSIITFSRVFPEFSSSYLTICMQIELILDGFTFSSMHQQVYKTLNSNINHQYRKNLRIGMNHI